MVTSDKLKILFFFFFHFAFFPKIHLCTNNWHRRETFGYAVGWVSRGEKEKNKTVPAFTCASPGGCSVPGGTPGPAALGARAGAEPTSPGRRVCFTANSGAGCCRSRFRGRLRARDGSEPARPQARGGFSPFLGDVRVRAA